MEDNLYKLYLIDLIHLIQEQALDARNARDQSIGATDNQFFEGRLSAFHDVVELMYLQAKAFQIPTEDLKLTILAKDHLI